MYSFNSATTERPGILSLLVIDPHTRRNARFATAAAATGLLPRCTYTSDPGHALRLLRHGNYDAIVCDIAAASGATEFIYHATALAPAPFILLADEDDARVQGAEILMRTRGAKLLGVISDAVPLERLRAMLAAARQSEVSTHHAEQTRKPRTWSAAELEHGLDHDQFIPYFQPKVNLRTGRSCCVEVLARWAHPELGILPPQEFIEPMEKLGLIDRLTLSLLSQSLQHAEGRRHGDAALGLAINVSPVSLDDETLPHRIIDLTKKHGMSPDRLTIEVTETASTADKAVMLESLARLRMLGFPISVDDFGIGYSSLEMLSQVPFTELKIDRSFVCAAGNGDGKARTILESILHMATCLNLNTVAEGIENQAQLELIRRLGCTTGQGYLFGRPLPLDALLKTAAPPEVCEAA